ncbi:hypothetical protein ACFSQ7_18905 [Paenibacillus rhizoplanae]
MNAYIESFHSIFGERFVCKKRYFETFEEAYEAVAAYIEFLQRAPFSWQFAAFEPQAIPSRMESGQAKTDRNNAVNEKLRKTRVFLAECLHN